MVDKKKKKGKREKGKKRTLERWEMNEMDETRMTSLPNKMLSRKKAWNSWHSFFISNLFERMAFICILVMGYISWAFRSRGGSIQ